MTGLSLLRCLFFFAINSIHTNILLEKPKTLSCNEVTELASQWQTSMTWTMHKVIDCSFIYEKSVSGFSLKLFKVPVYVYRARVPYTWNEFQQAFKYTYYFAAPLSCESQVPQICSSGELCMFLKTKKYFFYTGAGISAAGNVATMKDLESSLELHKGKIHFLKSLWNTPEKLTDAFSAFCKSAIQSQPTAAHEVLKEIALKSSVAIVTENVDLLQQRTGIAPIHAASPELHAVLEKDLQEIEIIVCVGLSHDDRGLLARYKQAHPQGIIIAIDLHTPNYLSNADYFCQGDLQEIVLSLAQ